MRRAALGVLLLGLVVLAALVVALGPWALAAALPLAGVVAALGLSSTPSAPPPAALPGQDELAGVREPLRSRARAALREAHAVVAALDGLEQPPPGLREHVVALARELVDAARRADRCDACLATVDRAAVEQRLAVAGGDARRALQDQLDALDTLERHRSALDERLVEVDASLGAMRARAVHAGVAAAGVGHLDGDVRALRDDVRALSEALDEVYGSLPEGS